MVFGMVLNFLNHKYYKDYLGIYTVVIPQFIFMLSIFGYLVILIIYKWCVNWKDTPAPFSFYIFLSCFFFCTHMHFHVCLLVCVLFLLTNDSEKKEWNKIKIKKNIKKKKIVNNNIDCNDTWFSKKDGGQ